MKRTLALLAVLASASCATGPTKEQALVARAAQALGIERWAAVQALHIRGSVRQWEPEQSDLPGGEMRFANESSFEMLLDPSTRTSRTDWERRYAYPAPRVFKYSEIVTPGAGFVLGIDSNSRNAQNLKSNPPAHAMSSLRLAATQRELRRGAIRSLVLAMRMNPARVAPALDLVAAGRTLPAVAFEGFTVAFDPQTGLPERVRTLDYDNVWGDVTYDLVLGDWRDVGGFGRMPFKQRYELNGRSISEIEYTEAAVNLPLDAARFAVPPELRPAAAAPASGSVPYQWVLRRQMIGIYLDSEERSYDARASQSLRLNELAPGVFHFTGGSHHSLLVEMSDHLVVVDAPISDEQSLRLLATARERLPGKPIRYVVLTHHHMDHAGGLRGMLEPGTTLVVGAPAMAHYRRVLAAPMTRNPDMKPRDFSGLPILEVPESHVIRDANGRQVIVYAVHDNPHAKGMLLAYVPQARLGFVTDLWSPGVPLPEKANPALLSVINTVKRAGITPERFAGGHGSVAPYAALAKLGGQ